MYSLRFISTFNRGRTKKKLSESTPLAENDREDQLRKIGALIRFYFHLDPSAMSDEEFVERWRELEYCFKFEKNRVNNEPIR